MPHWNLQPKSVGSQPEPKRGRDMFIDDEIIQVLVTTQTTAAR